MNDESVKLIRENVEYLRDKKPSEILSWAAKHPREIKHIVGRLNDFECGYCAKGILGQVAYLTHFGNTSYYSDGTDIIPESFNPQLDIKYMYHIKNGVPLEDVKYPLSDEELRLINLTIVKMNDTDKANLGMIAKYLESVGL